MKWLVLCWIILAGCGGGPISPETQTLSAFMSIANVSRDPVFNPSGEIIGVNLSAEVINTGPIPIGSPFVMTWRLRSANNSEIARVTHRFARFDAGETQRVLLAMTFDARSSLSGVRDAVTFDFEDPQSEILISQRNSAAIAGAGVFLTSSGGPCNTCVYNWQGCRV